MKQPPMLPPAAAFRIRQSGGDRGPATHGRADKAETADHQRPARGFRHGARGERGDKCTVVCAAAPAEKPASQPSCRMASTSSMASGMSTRGCNAVSNPASPGSNIGVVRTGHHQRPAIAQPPHQRADFALRCLGFAALHRPALGEVVLQLRRGTRFPPPALHRRCPAPPAAISGSPTS